MLTPSRSAPAMRRRMREAVRGFTPGERLRLSRRVAGLTQQEAAKKHGVTRGVYRGWEEDEGRVPHVTCPVNSASLHELVSVYCRRHGITLSQIATATGMSIPWVHAVLVVENDGAERVIDYLLGEKE